MHLSLNNISKQFDGQWVLDRVTMEVKDIHTLVLIGPSGGGKSTLLRIIGGLEFPEEGTLAFNGETVTFEENSLRHYRRRIGTVFQSFNLFPHLTAFQNVTLPLEQVHGLKPEQAIETSRVLFERFKLSNHGSKRPAELSGGQRQRVAIVRALAIQPQLLLMDEPTSALDPELTAEVLDMISDLRDEGRNLILVTHEMGFAKQVADRVALIAEGRIVETGSVTDVFDHPQSDLAREFLSKVLKY